MLDKILSWIGYTCLFLAVCVFLSPYISLWKLAITLSVTAVVVLIVCCFAWDSSGMEDWSRRSKKRKETNNEKAT